MTALMIRYGHGRRPTARAIRAHPCGSWSSGCVRPMCTRSELTRSPSAPSTAGRSVAAARTDTPTAIAAVNPSVDTSGIPATTSEQSAMTTVVPANTTAPPAVAAARAADSCTSTPSASWSLCLVTMKRA